jgi:hypothetical protein
MWPRKWGWGGARLLSKEQRNQNQKKEKFQILKPKNKSFYVGFYVLAAVTAKRMIS